MVWVFVHVDWAAAAGAGAGDRELGWRAWRIAVLGRLRSVGHAEPEAGVSGDDGGGARADSADGVSQSGLAAGGVLPDAGVYGGECEPIYSL